MLRFITTLFVSILLIQAEAQSKKEIMETLRKEAIKEVVVNLFVSTDNRNWEEVASSFATEVTLDYTSMAGGKPARLSPEQIIGSWKTILPGFQFTQHAVSNFAVDVKDATATVSHYGRADHYLESKGGNLWTVTGTYDHELTKTDKGWKVSGMKFNLKYMDGNMDLPRIAQERVKGIDLKVVSPGSRNKATVRTFFDLLEKENIEDFIRLFAEDGQQVNPYASGLFPSGAKGHEALRAYWEPVPGLFDGMSFPIEEIYAMEDEAMVFVKYTGRIKLKENAGYYENQYYSTFKFNEQGKITEYVEIFNPIVAARGFGLLDKIK